MWVGVGVGVGVGVLKGSLVIDSRVSRTTVTEEQYVTTFLSSSVTFISVLQRKVSFSSVGFA